VRTLKLTIAYDGTAYAGWQFQPDRPTVQRTLESALEKVAGETIRVLASGRTDAGVHALGQVVALRTASSLAPDVLRRALNANLPDDIAVLDVTEAPEDFHPISHVRRKRYRYVIHDGPVRDVFMRHYAWEYAHGRLDVEAMARAAAALRGTHDFRSFETAGAPRATSVRTIFDISVRRGRAGDCPNFCEDAMPKGAVPFFGGDDFEQNDAEPAEKGDSPQPSGDFITIEVEADGFLYNMVRAIVGTLVEVGRGRRLESWPCEAMAAMDRAAAGPTAPPQGLFLVRVEY
jgi:tRNA pseudouridine38-40 synthase